MICERQFNSYICGYEVNVVKYINLSFLSGNPLIKEFIPVDECYFSKSRTMTVPKDLEDFHLLNLLNFKKEEAYLYIFDKYFVVLCRYANVYMPTMQDSEDIVLDVFMRLWEKSDEITIETSLKSYLFSAVRNKSLNYLRDRRPHIPIEIMRELPDNFYDQIELDELDNLIQEAVLSLPSKCREVFSLSREKSMPNKEIALRLGISVKSVEARITKALKLIKRALF